MTLIPLKMPKKIIHETLIWFCWKTTQKPLSEKTHVCLFGRLTQNLTVAQTVLVTTTDVTIILFTLCVIKGLAELETTVATSHVTVCPLLSRDSVLLTEMLQEWQETKKSSLEDWIDSGSRKREKVWDAFMV